MVRLIGKTVLPRHVLTLLSINLRRQAMGDIHIWIGKDTIARDLLVKRGKQYGDRHELPAAVGIKGGSEILPLMGIGENVSKAEHGRYGHMV